MGVFTHLTRLQFHPATASVHSGAILQVELTLHCLMPVSVCIQQLGASVHFDLERGNNGNSKAAQRQLSTRVVEFCQSGSSASPLSSAAHSSLELDEVYDRSPTDSSLNSTGVVCKNTHLLIHRHDSNSLPDIPNCVSPPAITLNEGSKMLKVEDVTLDPGNNSIILTAPVRRFFKFKKNQLFKCLTQKWRFYHIPLS